MSRYLCLLAVLLYGQMVMAQQRVPSVRIVAVQAGNNQKDSSFIHIDPSPKGTIRLPYNQNYLLFSFVNHTRPAVKTFRYKLTGLDYSWITCTDCSQAIYAHLDGGDYRFQVKTAEVNAVPAVFSFTVEGNSWHKWWFVPMLFGYVLAVLGVGIYFFVLYRFRLKLREQRHIHKAKMASMAELTAGIAHEIQNPLNFVNNFAEVSVELIEELIDGPLSQLSESGKDDANDILTDLTQNLQRIRQYGERASNIVTGMLDHSRVNTGERQPTYLTALADEYLRLAYQGMCSRDKDFKCTLETHADPNLPLVRIVPQDISRVLINLFSNAFYAVSQKQKTAPADYFPTVSIRIARIRNKVEIRVQDNGVGIPEAIQSKIFQPFFTTKPTGEGTGLGLSLSYDIVTKGHGGTLTVESLEGVGTEFVITLPT